MKEYMNDTANEKKKLNIFEKVNAAKKITEEVFGVIPDGMTLMKGIAGNFRRFSELVCELIDNSISNLKANTGNEKLSHTIVIEVERGEGYVDVAVCDGGTGIRDFDKALRIAHGSSESPLNEHAFGLKHIFASTSQHWTIQTRTEEDAARGVYREVNGPYDIDGMTCVTMEGDCRIIDPTGTAVLFRCPVAMFETLKPKNKSVELSQEEMLDYLEEDLRYIYAELLEQGFIDFIIVSDEDMRIVNEPLTPFWNPETYRELDSVVTDFGGGPVKVFCRYGQIIGNKENKLYFRGTMDSSGVLIYYNGRLVSSGLFEKVWGEKLHPSQNHYLCQVFLEYDDVSAVPATLTAKNGLREGSDRLEALCQWIRKNIEKPKRDTESPERRLVRLLYEKRLADPDVLRVTMEEPAYASIALKTSVDLFESRKDDTAIIYEAKVGYSKPINAYQTMMYWDGCVRDKKPPTKAILIAKGHPQDVRRLIEDLNRRKDARGVHYNFFLSTWAEEGVGSKPDDDKDPTEVA